MIKVVQLIHGLNMGGAEKIVKDYALGLNKQLFSVTVLCYERLNSPYDRLLQESGIPVIYVCDEIPAFMRYNTLPNRVMRFLLRMLLIRKHIRRLQPDVIHLHLELHSYLKASRPKKGTAVVYTHHFDPIYWSKRDIRAARWIMKRYPYFPIALNKDMKRELDCIFNTEKTIVVNNGINLRCFDNVKSKAVMREELGIPLNAFVVAHVGRLDPVKNHKFLIGVFNEICHRHKNSYLILIGSGDEKDRIVTQIECLGLREKVVLLSNRVDVPDLLHAADAFVFPSLSEGLPISVIEAQAAGLTCVVSEAVPEHAMVSNSIFRLSLKDSEETWALRALLGRPEHIEYYNIEKWDIASSIRQIESIYFDSLTV